MPDPFAREGVASAEAAREKGRQPGIGGEPNRGEATGCPRAGLGEHPVGTNRICWPKDNEVSQRGGVIG